MKKTIDDISTLWLRRKAESLSELENRVLKSAIERQAVSRDTNGAFMKSRGAGDRIADAIARVGGSWTFILSFLLFLAVWTGLNLWLLGADAFDPYPFIFLNLVLSMIAALQAPIIMMSQNRQAERDRIDASHDYEVNLKAEIEIMALHEKLDELRHRELVTVRDDVARIAAMMERLDAARSPAAKPRRAKAAKAD